MRLRLGVTFHHVFYAPYLVALHQHRFAAEGLELEAKTYGDGARLLQDLESGLLDVGLGGVMRSIVSYDQGSTHVPIHFARVNDRDGFFLVSRSPTFEWADLLGRRLIQFSEAPTPWFVLRGLLKHMGLEPDAIDLVSGVPAPEAVQRFAAGESDFIQTPAQFAEALAAEGAGHIVREMAHEAGAIPYSSYAAMPLTLARDQMAIADFLRAHMLTLRWIQEVSGADVWDVIAPAFPDADPTVYRKAVERYHRLGAWSGDATLPREGYERLAGLLKEGGLVQRLAPYEVVIDDSLARAAQTGSSSALQ